MATAWNLDADTLRELNDLVSSGRFASPDAAVREGLRLIREQDDVDEEVDLDSLDPETRRAIEIGLADVEASRTEDADVVFARLRERYANWPHAAE